MARKYNFSERFLISTRDRRNLDFSSVRYDALEIDHDLVELRQFYNVHGDMSQASCKVKQNRP